MRGADTALTGARLDKFDLIYACAEHLVTLGDAYVDDLSVEEMRNYSGTLTTPGRNIPWWNWPVEESLELLQGMVRGGAAEGSMVLRAKVDMASPNLNMRDPTLYCVMDMPHKNTGNAWIALPPPRPEPHSQPSLAIYRRFRKNIDNRERKIASREC